MLSSEGAGSRVAVLAGPVGAAGAAKGGREGWVRDASSVVWAAAEGPAAGAAGWREAEGTTAAAEVAVAAGGRASGGAGCRPAEGGGGQVPSEVPSEVVTDDHCASPHPASSLRPCSVGQHARRQPCRWQPYRWQPYQWQHQPSHSRKQRQGTGGPAVHHASHTPRQPHTTPAVSRHSPSTLPSRHCWSSQEAWARLTWQRGHLTQLIPAHARTTPTPGRSLVPSTAPAAAGAAAANIRASSWRGWPSSCCRRGCGSSS